MRTFRTAALLWLVAAVAWAGESGGKTYPLTPGSGPGPRGGYTRVTLGENGLGEMPFATASGKLRFKTDKNAIQVDLNDDGQFADTESAKPGTTVQMPIKVAEKPFSYSMMVYGGGQNLIVMSLASLTTNVDGVKVTLLDGNCNGRFGDLWNGTEGQCDMIQVGKGTPQPLARYATIGSNMYEFEVIDGGANLRLQPYTGTTSTISVSTQDGYTAVAQLRNKDNGWTAGIKSGESIVGLPGNYSIASVQLRSTPAKQAGGQAAQPGVMLYGKGGKDVAIKEGENALNFGLPLKLELKALNTVQGVSVKEVLLVGAAGEAYPANNYGSNNKSTLTTELRSGSEKMPGAKLSYG